MFTIVRAWLVSYVTYPVRDIQGNTNWKVLRVYWAISKVCIIYFR